MRKRKSRIRRDFRYRRRRPYNVEKSLVENLEYREFLGWGRVEELGETVGAESEIVGEDCE